MKTLHRFKLLAMHCGGFQSPNRSSPRASPLVQQLRRRKTTLRMLLSRRGTRLLQQERLSDNNHKKKKKKKSGDRVRRPSLKDLFGSSSSPPGQESNPNSNFYNYNYNYNNIKEDEIHRSISNAGSGYGNGSTRPGWRIGFRYRSLLSLRKAWRPVLLTIAE